MKGGVAGGESVTTASPVKRPDGACVGATPIGLHLLLEPASVGTEDGRRESDGALQTSMTMPHFLPVAAIGVRDAVGRLDGMGASVGRGAGVREAAERRMAMGMSVAVGRRVGGDGVGGLVEGVTGHRLGVGVGGGGDGGHGVDRRRLGGVADDALTPPYSRGWCNGRLSVGSR